MNGKMKQMIILRKYKYCENREVEYRFTNIGFTSIVLLLFLATALTKTKYKGKCNEMRLYVACGYETKYNII